MQVQWSSPSVPRCRSDTGANVLQIPNVLPSVVRSSLQPRGQQRSHAVRMLGESRRALGPLHAAETDVKASSTGARDDFIETVLEKPLGLRFTRGNDGGAYVTVNDPKLGNTDQRVEVGDKVVQCSASFGEDVWDAKNFGQVMFAIRTRNGGVFLKFKKMYGDFSQIEDSGADGSWKREQNSGNVGLATREKQRKNYIENKQREAERIVLFNGALAKFRSKDFEGALIDFENVAAMEPKKYMGDNFARYTDVYPYSQYNAACCYASMNQVEAGLEALEGALKAGFDDYQKVRTDPNLAGLRVDDRLADIVSQYDEPVLNENAVRALKNIFSFGRSDADA